MSDTPLTRMLDHGQSPWIDYLSRPFVRDGDLEGLVRDGIRGVTSNPTIFQAAIADGDAYDDQLREVLKTETDPKEVFLALAVEDIRGACDILRAEWDRVGENARDGWVSLEVDPNLAHDTQRTIEEAKRLHPGARPRARDRGAQAPAGSRRPPKCFQKDPRHARGPAGDRGDDRGRHPGERHAHLLAPAAPRRGGGLHPRAAAVRGRRRRP